MEEDDIPILIDTTSQNEISNLDDTSISPSVPLTIICGFLGAGKSTLVKRILTERHGYRIAVIMNEFGDTVDIEAKAINISSTEDPLAESSEEFLELANGCLCCSIKDAGVAAIEKLMQRKGTFDHILLETTGLADPGPIASMFWQNEEFSMGLGRDIHLDGVVCVVDAVFGQKQMEEDHAADGIGESLRQIAGSDVILLNKVDLVPETDVEHTEDLIRKINPASAIYRTIKADIDLGIIMGIDAYSSRPLPAESVRELSHVHSVHDHDDQNHTHAPSESLTHYEIRGISSVKISCPPLTSLQMQQLDEWIRSVLWENCLPDGSKGAAGRLEILRCKGMFLLESGEVYVLQGVRTLYEISKVEQSSSEMGVLESGKLVLIGKGLDNNVRHSLEQIFKSI